MTTSIIPGTIFEGIRLRGGLYQITSDIGTSPIFPFTCTGQSGMQYKNCIVYILNGEMSKIASCNSVLSFSICEHCFQSLPARLQSMFIPVFVAQYDGVIKCSSHYLSFNHIDSIKCVVYGKYIINVEYKNQTGTWIFADVDIDANTMTIKFPVAECEFRINVISGFYPENNDYSTYTLNSVSEDLTILSKMFDKNFYSLIGISNIITISKSQFNAVSNSAQALKFTAVSKELASSASLLSSVPEVREYGHNRLYLCVHSAKLNSIVPVVHTGIACNGYCGQHNFSGTRYYCSLCDFDLCQSCYNRGFSHVHKLFHSTTNVNVGVRTPYTPLFPPAAPVSMFGFTASATASSCATPSSLYKFSGSPFAASATAVPTSSGATLSSLYKFSGSPFAASASAVPTSSLFTGAITPGSVQSNVTTSTGRFVDHTDLLELFIQIFCTDASAVEATSEKFKETIVPTIPPRWTFTSA